MAKREPDIRKLAARQRWMLWLVLFSIATQFAPLLSAYSSSVILDIALLLVQLAMYVLMVVGVVLILIADGTNVAIIVLCGVLTLAPCVNILVLLVMNRGVTRTLRSAGLHVGLMGVDPEEVERTINAELCTGCGYNLTGNVSGFCTECGRPLDRAAND